MRGIFNLITNNGKQDRMLMGDGQLMWNLHRLSGRLCYWSEERCDKIQHGNNYCRDHLPYVQERVIELGRALLNRPDINRDMRTYLMKTLFYRWSIQLTPLDNPTVADIEKVGMDSFWPSEPTPPALAERLLDIERILARNPNVEDRK
jgi:hypothetical protein